MGLWGTRPLRHRAHHPETGKMRQEGRREEEPGGEAAGEQHGAKINPYPCLNAPVWPVTPNSSSVKVKCHTFHLLTLSCGLLIALAEHSFIKVWLWCGWERGLRGPAGPGEGQWHL